MIQKIPAKYMNTAWAKKTNVRIFTTAQHSLRCRFFGRTQQALNVVFFTPTQHSLRFNTFYLRRHNTPIQPFLTYDSNIPSGIQPRT